MEKGLTGSIPQLNRSGQTPGPKALFHSVRDIALIIDKTVQKGYGALVAGTLAGINVVTSDLVPYPGSNPLDTTTSARTFLVVDGVDTEAFVYTTIAESYKFAVGDSLIIDRDNAGAQDVQDLGVITAIDVTTDQTRAKITATSAISGANHTVANGASVYVKSDASTPFAKASYVIDQAIYTGSGEDADGALTSVAISNCVLYKNAIPNYDAAALADLGGLLDGRLLILK